MDLELFGISDRVVEHFKPLIEEHARQFVALVFADIADFHPATQGTSDRRCQGNQKEILLPLGTNNSPGPVWNMTDLIRGSRERARLPLIKRLLRRGWVAVRRQMRLLRRPSGPTADLDDD